MSHVQRFEHAELLVLLFTFGSRHKQFKELRAQCEDFSNVLVIYIKHGLCLAGRA